MPVINIHNVAKRQKKKQQVVETIELSSEEDESKSVSLMSLSDLQKAVRGLKEENEQLKAQATQAARQAEELRSELKDVKKSLSTNREALENLDMSATCEVCDDRLCGPSVLSCGHVFCEACIQKWFRSILMEYCAKNEGFDPRSDLLEGFLGNLQSPDLSELERNQMMHELRDLYVASQKPTYTCPKCRQQIVAPPVQCVWAKGLVAELAQWAKDDYEDKTANEVPWEIFFPLCAIPYF